jgi:hypothetical protein
MRKKIPHFTFYGEDFLDGTRGMPSAEVGDYIRLLCMIYDADGRLRFEPYGMRSLLGCTRSIDVVQRVMRLVARGKLNLSADGYLTNGRATKEVEKRQKWQEMSGAANPAANPAAKGAAKPQTSSKKSKQNQEGSVHSRRNPVPEDTTYQKEPTVPSSPPYHSKPDGFVLTPNEEKPAKPKQAKADFEAWYSHYPHKVQRGAAERAFPKALALAGLDQLIAGTDRYVRDKPAHVAYRNPATWLNGQGWLDQPGVEPTQAKPQQQNFSSYLMGELDKLQENGNAQRPSFEHRDLDTGIGDREDPGIGHPGQPAYAKPH